METRSLNFQTAAQISRMSLVVGLSLSFFLSFATVPSACAEAGKDAIPQAKQQVTEAQVQAATTALEKLAQKEIDEKSVTGIAIGVVHNNKLVYAKGFGVREVGKPEKIDPDTVFQLASCSKPISSTVISGLIGDGKITWDSKISDLDPNFKMNDPWVTSQITLRDFCAHRSGLPDHAGDLLEDLGGDRADVLYHLRFQKPDSSFRSHYAYTNFGITEAAVAAAKAYGLKWEEASEQKLYRPLGMTSTSSTYADFMSRSDKALGHVLVNGKWAHTEQRQPDAQSPAGGASSSVNDMVKWMRLEMDNGKFEGKQIIAEAPLIETHHPAMLTQFNPFNGLPGFYGLGINVGYDEHGRLRLGHSGAFSMGAATNVTMIPSEKLGIVVLTNCYPVGVAEGLANSFMDIALEGKQSQDWLPFFKKVFANPAALGEVAGFDYSKAPSSPAPAFNNNAYVGTYRNDFFGNMEVKENNGQLAAVLGPHKLICAMKHYDRDTFTYHSFGENEVGVSGITFTMGPDGKATSVFIENLNTCGEGTFKRVQK